jgi:hypothetical protein
MAEAVEGIVEAGHGTPVTGAGFEPDILAFCCEH